MDDSEYVRNVKAVIDATDVFVEGNQEVVQDRNLLKHVLYSYSKDLWRSTASDNKIQSAAPRIKEKAAPKKTAASSDGAASQADTPPTDDATLDDDGYRDYYFDYLYRHGVYPR